MCRNVLLFVTTVLLSMQLGCLAARPNSAAGGLLGGTTGGILGAAIGSHNGKTKEGALIGAVAGGLSGMAIGNQTDEANIQNQRLANQQLAIAQQAAVTIPQVIEMSTSGLSDQLIINQINTNGMAQKLSTNDLIELKSRGLSDPVIREMQTVGNRPAPIAAPRLMAPRPLFVEPYCDSIYHGPPVYHRRGHHAHSGFSFHF